MQESPDERQRNPWEEDPWDKEYPYEYYQYEVDKKEKIATVTLTNPTGADSAPWWACYQGVKAIDRWERDDDVKVVIIKGGGKHWCTGHDLDAYLSSAGARAEPREATAGKKHRRTNRQTLLLMRDDWLFQTRLLYSLKPTIAQVHGSCIEYGNGLQIACDMTIASDDAHFGNLGQVIGISGIVPLTPLSNLIGYKRFREMMISGRTVSAKQAASMGLINRAVPRKKLDEEVWNEARRIAVIPIDGLVTGKAYTHLSLEEMGMGASILRSAYAWAGFTLTVNVEPDEFKFFDIIREKGLREALRRRREIYEPLGGFGPDAERDPV